MIPLVLAGKTYYGPRDYLIDADISKSLSFVDLKVSNLWKIFDYLSDADKLQLASTSKFMRKLVVWNAISKQYFPIEKFIALARADKRSCLSNIEARTLEVFLGENVIEIPRVCRQSIERELIKELSTLDPAQVITLCMNENGSAEPWKTNLFNIAKTILEAAQPSGAHLEDNFGGLVASIFVEDLPLSLRDKLLMGGVELFAKAGFIPEAIELINKIEKSHYLAFTTMVGSLSDETLDKLQSRKCDKKSDWEKMSEDQAWDEMNVGRLTANFEGITLKQTIGYFLIARLIKDKKFLQAEEVLNRLPGMTVDQGLFLAIIVVDIVYGEQGYDADFLHDEFKKIPKNLTLVPICFVLIIKELRTFKEALAERKRDPTLKAVWE